MEERWCLSLTTSYLLPPLLNLTSISSSYLPFYLLPPFLPPTSLSTSHLPFYLLSPTSYLLPTFLSTSYLSYCFLPISYLLPHFLPSASLSTSYLPRTSYLPFYQLLPFYLLPPFLPPTSLFTSYLTFYLLLPFLSPTSLSTSSFYLTHFEKSAISLICLTIAIYSMLRSHASRGHTLSFQQDISDFVHLLPCLPEELPVIVLKSPNATITDGSFLVKRDKLITVLQFRKENNEDYRYIQISTKNASIYPEDAIIQFVTQIDSSAHNTPQE